MVLKITGFEKAAPSEMEAENFDESFRVEKCKRAVFEGFEDEKYWVSCTTKEPVGSAHLYTQLEVEDPYGNPMTIWVNIRSFWEKMTQDELVISHVFSKAFPESDAVKPVRQLEEINRHTKNPLTLSDMEKLEEVCKKAPRGEGRLSKKKHGLARTVVTDSSGQGLILLSSKRSKNDKPYGEGSFGKVMRAIHPTDPVQDKAVKVVRKEKVEAVDWKDAETEALFMESLKEKKHIVKFDRSFVVNDPKRGSKRYVVMEKCDRGDLRQKICLQKMTSEEKHRLAGECLEGLFEIHEEGIVHRDIKPNNIFLKGENESVKIGDFGLASKKEKMGKELCGTPEYIAPEIPKRAPQDEKVDVWAMGCTLFQLLGKGCSFSFFGRARLPEIVLRIIRGLNQKQIDGEIEEKIPPEYRSLLKGMLQIDPEKRFSTEKALQEFRAIPRP